VLFEKKASLWSIHMMCRQIEGAGVCQLKAVLEKEVLMQVELGCKKTKRASTNYILPVVSCKLQSL
jgi:hypothetical protein